MEEISRYGNARIYYIPVQFSIPIFLIKPGAEV